QPLVEVADRREHVAAGEDEVEAAAVELERELVDVGVVVRDVRRAFAGDLDLLGGDVDRGHERAALDELRRRLTRRALQVQDVLALHVGNQVEDRLRDQQLLGRGAGAAAVDLVPGAAVLVSRLHDSLVTQCYKVRFAAAALLARSRIKSRSPSSTMTQSEVRARRSTRSSSSRLISLLVSRISIQGSCA